MRKVLIIGDENENLNLLSEMLKESGFEPLTASAGLRGIQIAVQEQPNLILLDLNMPEMDGYEVCRRLRDQPSTRKIPIIMLTSEAALDSRVKGLDQGADDYM